MPGHALPSTAHQIQLPPGLSDQSSTAVLTLWCQRCSLGCKALLSGLHQRVDQQGGTLRRFSSSSTASPLQPKLPKTPQGISFALGSRSIAPSAVCTCEVPPSFENIACGLRQICHTIAVPNDSRGILYAFIAEIQIRNDMRELERGLMRCHMGRHVAVRKTRQTTRQESNASGHTAQERN